MPNIIKVANSSNPTTVAGAIAGTIRDHGSAEVQAIGAGAVNQAVKSIAIAGNYLKGDGIEISASPSFIDIDIDEKKRTAIRFSILAFKERQ